VVYNDNLYLYFFINKKLYNKESKYIGHGQKSLQRHTVRVVSRGLVRGGSHPPFYFIYFNKLG
jgi:hypothetical protein